MNRPSRGVPMEPAAALGILRDTSVSPRARDIAAWRVLGYTVGEDDTRTYWSKAPRGPECISNGRDLHAAADLFPDDVAGLVSSWNIPAVTVSIDAALALAEQRIGSDAALGLLKEAVAGALSRDHVAMYVVDRLLAVHGDA